MKRPSLNDVLDHVARTYDVPRELIAGPGRNGRRVSRARQLYYWVAGAAGYGVTETAHFLKRNHASAIFGCRRIDEAIATGEIDPPTVPLRREEPALEPTQESDVAPEPCSLLDWQRFYRPCVQVTCSPILPEMKIKHQPVRRRYRVVPPAARPAAIPANVTALLMGDPPPSRSALALEAAE